MNRFGRTLLMPWEKLVPQPSQPSWKLGEEMEIRVWIKNFGDAPVTLFIQRPRRSNYRVAVFDKDGRPVRKSELGEAAEGLAHRPRRRVVSETGTDLEPDEMTPGLLALPVSQWFHIEKPGAYVVIVMRRLWTWKDGFLISNMARFHVTK